MTLVDLTVVAAEPDLPEDHWDGQVRMIPGLFAAREVQPLDYLHDPTWPGRVVAVNEVPEGYSIHVRTRSVVGTWATVIIYKAPCARVELSRLVNEHLERDAEGL